MPDQRQNKHEGRCALVTGATGYIGSHLVGGLLDAGWQVHVIARQTSSLHLLEAYLGRITVHRHDASMEGMSNIVAKAKPDVTYHLAAMASSEHRMGDIEQMLGANVLFSTQLIEAMFRHGVKHLVNTETFWQHRTGADEYVPVCLYAATKQAFHDILLYYIEAGHLNALSLILYDTYGADDPRKKLFSFLKQAIQDRGQIDMTLGEQIIDITHIDDVVAAYLRAGDMLLSESCGRLDAYAVTSGQRMTLRQLIELIEHEIDVQIHVNWGGKPYRKNEVMNPWLGNPLPGWRATIELTDGIREVFKGLT